MHYTDDWPEAAKEAFKERMREEVKEDIRHEMQGCDEEWIQNDIQDQMAERLQVKLENVDVREYWSIYSILEDDFDNEIDSMNLNDEDNTTLKLLQFLTKQVIELTALVIDLEERQRTIDYNLWQFKDFYAQKNGPFEHKSRKDYE
jgi:hypothetical protein